jgi:type IV conjugative transfer system protein TraE
VNITVYRDKLANLEFGVKALLLVVLGLVVALIANGFFARQVVVHVAPVDVTRPYEVTDRSASPEYLKQMALSLTPLFANVTPSSVDVSHAAFRRYLAPRAYGAISEALTADAQYIKQYQVARVFWPDQVEQQGDRVTLIGREHRMIGHNKVAEEERAYTLRLQMRDWQVQVVDLAVMDAGEYRESRKSRVAAR